MNRVKKVVGCDWWVSVFIVWLGLCPQESFTTHFLKGLFQDFTLHYDYWLMNFGVPRCRIDVIDTICDERLALTDILTER